MQQAFAEGGREHTHAPRTIEADTAGASDRVRYMLMPDHAPTHPDDKSPPGTSGRVKQAWAYQFGYM